MEPVEISSRLLSLTLSSLSIIYPVIILIKVVGWSAMMIQFIKKVNKLNKIWNRLGKEMFSRDSPVWAIAATIAGAFLQKNIYVLMILAIDL